jgi:hypothetical protein
VSKPIWRVAVRQADGVLVKEHERGSKYAAKKLREALAEKYDESHSIEVIPPK